MTDILKLEIQTICIVHLIAITLSILFLMIFYIKAQKNKALNWFIVVQCSMIGWMIFKVLKTVAPTVTLRWLFIVGYFICACILEMAFLEFGYTYLYNKPLKKTVRIILWTIVGLQIIMIATNPLHHLFYRTYDFWGDSFGILFILHTVIEYSFIGVGFYYCRKMYSIRFENKNRYFRSFVSIAILLPLAINLLFITKVIHRFIFSLGWYVIFDLTPIMFTWSTLIFVFATFKSDFISLSPILRHEIVHRLDTPIAVIKGQDYIYKNKAFHNLKLESESQLLNQYTVNQGKDNFEFYETDKYYQIKCLSIKNQNLLILKDITPYRIVELEIQKNQKELNDTNTSLTEHIEMLKESSKFGARNYVARELHDIIGHSLVVTIKLLEVAKMYHNSDIAEEAIRDAVTSLDSGMTSMNNILENQSHVKYSTTLLKKELQRMLDTIKHTGITAKLSVKASDIIIEEQTYDILKKVTQELITNALKHSHAKEIFISLNFTNKLINMMVIDNGVGRISLREGNGLKGIRSRLELIKGSIEFVTNKNEGFLSRIRIET